MERLVRKYAAKLHDAGLTAAAQGDESALIYGLDADAVWNRKGPERPLLEQVAAGLTVNSLVFARPAEPYHTIISHLAQDTSAITPKDCETRTFLHDLPVIQGSWAAEIIQALKRRKGVIIREPDGRVGILAFGTVSPEQGFVTVSSICFACFVKFFADYLQAVKSGAVSPALQKAFEQAVSQPDPVPTKAPELMSGPFEREADVYSALVQAGRATVEYRLVDSYFGNISSLYNDVLYISQTGSSLDELEGCIDPCPMDGSSCAGLTASSELTAHMDVLRRTGKRCILHGHPKFSVILSMDCDRRACPQVGECHIKCPQKRDILGIPVVPGEVGTGPFGLCNTLPPALEGPAGAIVYGHGLFTTGDTDFNAAFKALLEIETMCRQEYFRRVA